MATSEEIKSAAPVQAVYYRLRLPNSDGTAREHPTDPAAYYILGDAPWGIPSNQYFVQFYDADRRALQHKECLIRIEKTFPVSRTSGQLNLHLLNAQGAQAKAPTEPPLPAASRLNGEGATVSESELELRRHMQAMDLEERQQEFLKTSTYVTELGEAFTLNRLMRRDMLEMHRIIVEHSQRAYQDIEQVKGTIHELLAMQKAVLAHAASALARPPPPPPDYVSLGHSALAVVKDVSAALITRQMGRELASRTRGEAQPGAAKAQLGDGSQAKEAEIDRASPSTEKSVAEGSGGAAAGDGARAATNSPRDVLGRLMQRLQSVSDAELALAMSSVEGWKALLDSLSPADAAKDAAKDASAVTSPETSAAAGTKEAASGA